MANKKIKISNLQKLSLFSSLYFTQGLPYGFFTQALPVYLREAKVSLAAIGGTALLTLPWTLKFLWAPLADRYGIQKIGLRRSWILPLQLISALALLSISFFDPSNSLFIVLITFLICNFLAATQDIATDGLAIDLLAGEERGLANSIQVGAYRIGMIVGGSAMLILLANFGWQASLLAMAGIILIMTLPVFLFPETKVFLPTNLQEINKQKPLQDIKEFFSQPQIFSWIIILLVFKLSHQAANTMIKPWLVDTGYDLSEIGILMGIFGSGAGLTGAIIGGFLAKKEASRKRRLVTLCGLQALATSFFLFPILTEPSIWKPALAIAIDNGVSGAATVILFTLMMDRCRPKHSSTDYTFQAALVVLSQTIASSASGVLADRLGYSLYFLLIAALGFIIWGTLNAILSKKHDSIFKTMNVISPFLLSLTLLGLQAPRRAHAHDEVGIHFGPLLPSRIRHVKEIQNSWGLSAGTDTSKGFFELGWTNGRGSDVVYNAFSLDYRMPLLDASEHDENMIYFLLGFHMDHFKPRYQDDFKSTGGWHYGGGLLLPIGSRASPFLLKAEFKHRFSPGSSLLATIGFVYSL